MKSRQILRRSALWATLCMALAMSGCASLEPGKPEDQVRMRATERWQALVKGEFIRAYEYNTPGFKAVVTPDGFRNRFGGSVVWQNAEAINVNCPEPSRCIATIRLSYKPILAKQSAEPVTTHFEETWLREERQWWLFQKI